MTFRYSTNYATAVHVNGFDNSASEIKHVPLTQVYRRIRIFGLVNHCACMMPFIIATWKDIAVFACARMRARCVHTSVRVGVRLIRALFTRAIS